LVAAAMGAGPAACAKNPATGKPQLVLVPRKEEIALGKQAAEEVTDTIGAYPDRELNAYVASIGGQMAAMSERPHLPWQFQVVDDPAVNAFALPGGYVFVTRGLLAHLDNEAQLASVIGHEIGHVTGKHAVSRLGKAQVVALGFGLGTILSGQVARFRQLGELGVGLLFAKFSRDDEIEADDLGLRYTRATGYEVDEMPEVLSTLDRVSKAGDGGGRLPEWLSTHPSPGRRADRVRARIAARPVQVGGDVDRDEYLRAIDGMVVGIDPRHGYFVGEALVHPALGFTMMFPRGWRTANLTRAVVALSPAKDAAIELTVSRLPDPDRAAAAFVRRSGLRARGRPVVKAPGLPSTSVEFSAATEAGELAGLATFVGVGDRTLEVLMFTPAASLRAYAPVFVAAPRSIARMTDPRILGAQPARLRVEPAPATATLAELHRRRVPPGGPPIETIALINQMQPGTRVLGGQLIKWIQPGVAPGRRAMPRVSVAGTVGRGAVRPAARP
jgi:predicted Zn-dependent protease